MAIDSSLFAADIPAGTYAAGDVIAMKCIAGPSVVRDGYGAAYIKKIYASRGIYNANGVVNGRIHVQNSDWIDPVINTPCYLNVDIVGQSNESSACQSGNNCAVAPNSGWNIYFKFTAAGTTTAATSVFALIDIDYPSVSSVVDPEAATGIPTSIETDLGTVPLNTAGDALNASFTSVNSDIFKAGFKYLLQKLSVDNGNGFIAFANAAGMGGLQRIVPICSKADVEKYKVQYASPLTKGPMDIKTMFFAVTATTTTCSLLSDWVKKRA